MRLVDLMPLQEIDFPNQRAFDQYNKSHKLRPDTKVTVTGRVTTAGRAASNTQSVKGTSVFGNDTVKVDSGDDKKFPFVVTYIGKDGKTAIADKFVSKRDAQRMRTSIDPKHKPKVMATSDLSKQPVDIKPVVKSIANLTDKNDHNQAAMELAKFIGDKTYIEQIAKIQKYHELKGSIPQSLIQYRTTVVGNLIQQAKNKYGEEVAKQLNKSF